MKIFVTLVKILKMKFNQIFLIKTLNEPEESQSEKMILDVINCFEEGDENNYVIEDVNGLDYIFLRMSEYKVEKICKVLDKYIDYTIEEITNQIVSGEEADLKSIISNPDFKPFFDSFRIESTQVDDVLDKILSKGIDSLDDIDRQILSQSK